ncbi:MAG: hypothetical protein ACRD1I_07880, partial [Terriglobia bacterium]
IICCPLWSFRSAAATQKFPFHFLFRFAAEGWGEKPQKKCKEIFGVARASPRARLGRAQSVRVLLEMGSDFVV